MKSYLHLAAQSGKAHRERNRILVLCIAISAGLVTTIFGMADIGLRSERELYIRENGNAHVILRDISPQTAARIEAREDVAVSGWVLSPDRGSKEGRSIQMMGANEVVSGEMGLRIADGLFPANNGEAAVDRQFLEQFSVSLGDTVAITLPDGAETQVEISGVFSDLSNLMRGDAHGLVVSEAYGRKLFGEGVYASFIVQFRKGVNPLQAIDSLRAEYSLTEEQVSVNNILLGLMGYGYGSENTMSQLYGVALVLFCMVLAAGTVMISAGFNTIASERVRFYGLLRCIGATRRQIRRLVVADALRLSAKGIPLGIAAGTILMWAASAVLKYANSNYFAQLQVFQFSILGLGAGIVMGLATVLLASLSPARKAARVSPVTATSGNLEAVQYNPRRVSQTGRIEIGMGLSHALARKKNLVLMTCSFAISIVLFLGFQVFVSFLHESMPPLRPNAPDLTVMLEDGLLPYEVAHDLRDVSGVKAVYGRQFYSGVPVYSEQGEHTITLISYDKLQFQWAESDLVRGQLAEAEQSPGAVLTVHRNTADWAVGDVLTLRLPDGDHPITVAGTLGTIPFDQVPGSDGYLVCSEETFLTLGIGEGYTVVDVQLTDKGNDAAVSAVRGLLPSGASLSDRRLSNQEASANFYTLAVFVYGFLGIIAFITAVNILNSIYASVNSRLRQCGIMRALGMSARQLRHMVSAEALAYTGMGCFVGSMIGVPLHRFLHQELVYRQFGLAWRMPAASLLLILLLCLAAAALAVGRSMRQLRGSPLPQMQ